ncbi:MAG: ABC transporter ATP-binding protein [Bacillota bacterium]
MSVKAIEVKNIAFAYHRGRFVFRAFSQTFQHNTVYGIVGKNGVGKTTLGKLMVKLLPLDEGNIAINGVDISSMSLGEIGASVGYVYQNPSRQLFAMTVYEELAFPFLLNGEQKEAVHEKVMAQLEAFHLQHVKESFPFYLSQGEKQRLVLAGMLMRSLDFLILDEPTTALDVKRKKELVQCLKEIQETKQMGLILISHDKEFLEDMNAISVRLEGCHA